MLQREIFPAEMLNFTPLTEKENALLMKAAEIIRSQTAIECTGCQYCESYCPQNLPIRKYLEDVKEAFE